MFHTYIHAKSKKHKKTKPKAKLVICVQIIVLRRTQNSTNSLTIFPLSGREGAFLNFNYVQNFICSWASERAYTSRSNFVENAITTVVKESLLILRTDLKEFNLSSADVFRVAVCVPCHSFLW